MTTPSLSLPVLSGLGRAARTSLAPRLAFPMLVLGLVLCLAGYVAVGLLLLGALI